MMNLTKRVSSKEMPASEVKFLWKKIDRKFKDVTLDTETSGIPNELFQTQDDIPLRLLGIDDKLNALGGLNSQEIVNQMLNQTPQNAQRRARYKQLNDSLSHPEITGALNIYADEATTEDQNGDFIHVLHDDEELVEVVEAMFERIGVYNKAWHIIRNMCSFGDDFYEPIISQNLKRIVKLVFAPREYIERAEENGDLVGFKIANEDLINPTSQIVWQANYLSQSETERQLIFPFRLVHFRIESSKYMPYGESIIDSVIASIEMLSAMEKALLLARITRAPERRIFNIDVGTLTGEAAIKYANAVMNNFKNKRRLDLFLRDKIDYQRDIWGVTEDIVIPKRAGSENNTIDTLQQLNQPSTEDLDWIRDKIFPGVGIPRQYLIDDSFANANLNLSSKSVPFAKRIRRIQRYFIRGLYKLAYIELRLQGYSVHKIRDLVILMNNPSNIDEKERMEIQTGRWNLITAMKSLNAEKVFVPDYIIYKEVLQLGDEEVVEWMKLCELQAAGKNIFEAFPEDERPEGSEDLVGQQPGGEQAGGAGAPMPPGTEGGAPQEGGEEAPAEGEQEVPQDVEAALGPPPGAETAEYKNEFKTVVLYNEALKTKERFIKFIEQQKQQIHFKAIQEVAEVVKRQQQRKNKIKRSVFMEEIELSGEFNGLEQVYSNIKLLID
jgi:hypothetical protein